MMIRTFLFTLCLAVGSGILAPLGESAPVQAGAAQVVTLPQEAPGELRVRAGNSIVVSSADVLQRVSVTNAEVATATIVTPNQVLIHGQRSGSVTLLLWDDQERLRAFNLVVELDVPSARQTLQRMFPGEGMDLFQSGEALVLTGVASTEEVRERAALLLGTMSQTVVNLASTVENRQVVLLQVRFAEVDRTAVEQFGLNLISTGAANTPGTISTGQFGGVGGSGGGGGGRAVEVIGSDAIFSLTDLLNVFVFRPDLDLGATIRALQQDSLLQILAEPNVLALNGQEASFLAGGEFPFPVVQAGTGTTSLTIEFKEFGVRLTFTPNVRPDGTINLRVMPEVSALDFANALSISGFLVPALSTRRAETEVDLRDGQTFAIAGLIDSRLTEAALKVPVLGDIPIIGRLFRSRSQNENRTELLVMVTPHVVAAMEPDQVPPLPEFPAPFRTPEAFDGETGETPETGALVGPRVGEPEVGMAAVRP